MSIQFAPPKQVRPLTHHRDAPVTCQTCGRQVARRSRRQIYCSTRCRQESAVGALKLEGRNTPTALPTDPPRKVNKINTLAGRNLRSRLVDLEVFAGRDWLPVVSRDGVVSEIAQPHRRRPSRSRP